MKSYYPFLCRFYSLVVLLITTYSSSIALAGNTLNNNQARIINMVKFGADNTGMKDCSDLVRKAQQLGDVYFPKGTYLMSAVDVLSNRQYYGDGIGQSIIKGNTKGVKTIFGISTYPYDKSGHPNRNVENIQIHDLSIDFNFSDKWVEYFCPIQFKGAAGNYIKNIRLNNLEFFDSAKLLHPRVTGGKGGDAWCINFSSFCDSTTDIVIENCRSIAEGHQFVSGGGNILKRVKVLNNYILRPSANGISFTTVSQQLVNFEDFEVSGNTIEDAGASSILFGHDPSPYKKAIDKQTFSGLRVTNNTIILSNFMLYGTSYRKATSYPFIFNISGGEPYLKDVLIKDNNIIVKDNYSGGDIYLTKLQSYTYNRQSTTTAGAFTQPATNGSVTISVSSAATLNKPSFQTGGYIAITNGGIYKVKSVNGNNIELVLQNIGNYANVGSVINALSEVKFLGGLLSNISFVNNKVSGKKQLKFISSGVLDGLTFTGNDKTTFTLKYASSLITNATIANNNNFSLVKSGGYFNGLLKGNTLLSVKQAQKAIQVVEKVSQLTGFQEKTNLAQ